MVLLEEKLQNRIRRIAETAKTRSRGKALFEEMIALPYYGQIILRFRLEQDPITLTDLDALETLLYEIVGDEFLIDFMGSVYRKAGVDYANLENRLIRLAAELPEEWPAPSVHSAGIRRAAEFLLKTAGLKPDEKVWEIQEEGQEWLLLLMGKCNREIKTLDSPFRLTVAEVKEEPCVGLMKAALLAKRENKSLGRVLADR